MVVIPINHNEPDPAPPPRPGRPANQQQPPQQYGAVTVAGPSTQNWWGEGLPPPSFRKPTNPLPWNAVQNRPKPQAQAPPPSEASDLERRLQEVRKIDEAKNAEPKRPATLEELEERLAALRGCDVELIRNPRVWFDPKPGADLESDTPAGLINMAMDRQKIEDNVDRDLDDKFQRIRARYQGEQRDPAGEPDSSHQDDPRRSQVSEFSQNTEFSEATNEELRQINELMSAAENKARRQPNPKPTDDDLDKEARTVLAATRQASIDINKINSEFSNFYQKRIDDTKVDDDEDSNSSGSLDAETLRQIMEEAERAEDEETRKEVHQQMAAQRPAPPEASKKPGFLGKFFKK
ncbi:unnamed protein product, partial [Mesorhabditis spiculigera]